jgi:predicted phosphoribosyltransferase
MQRNEETELRQARWFRDRAEAGRFLAEHLARFRDERPVVLGIPRGGVPVAAEVARELGAELDVVVARKLGAPGFEELAIGAVTANGGRFLNQDVIDQLGVPEAYLQTVTAAQQAEARRRETMLRGVRPAARLEGRTVIIVDDGLATGATMRAAVASVRSQRPARLVATAPVGAYEACAALEKEADEVVCPHRPAMFGAVGQYYQHFEPVEDAEVRRLLEVTHPAGKA